MRDVFYTVVIIWIVWRIYHSFQAGKQNVKQQTRKREGEVTVDSSSSTKNKPDDGGEYVDFEEIKD